MDCIICGSWFASTIHDGACPTCSRAIKQLRLNITPDRLLELVQAEKDGRMVVLPSNDQLTLEELREMDGEPVWVEIPTNMVSEWCIAKFDPLMNRVRLWCSGGGWFDGRNVGKSLFVYRSKPKELEGGIEVC